jgi:peptide-methionine (S)-S-oxide reductase
MPCLLVAAALALLTLGCAPATESPMMPENTHPASRTEAADTATLGAGCYWCVEAVLQQVPGVLAVESGFSGGARPDPTYEEVCSGTTGHAEVVRVRFDPKVLSYSALLDWFFRLHDPTQKDRQGNDVGTQYRSVIFTHGAAQEREARAAIARWDEKLRAAGRGPVVTEVAPAGPFYPAPEKHKDYYRRNRGAPYCRFVIAPKLEHLELER